MSVYLAVDFGAGSGRVMAGFVSDGMVNLEEIYRFPNRQVRLGNHLYWDFPALFADMKQGIREAVRKGYHIKCIGIDTWGVDFGLIDKKGDLLGNPVCYRDSRTNGLSKEYFAGTDISRHYAEAGIQVMDINTLFQLYSLKKEEDASLAVADKLLFMPDLFSYFLTGVANNEYSIASTSELLDARSRTWNWDLIRQLGLPEHLFGEIVMPGTVRGTLKKELAEEFGLDYDVEVIAVGSHDTASAAYTAGMDAAPSVSAFLSSGTWSLLGIEVDEPILTEEARLAGFTNEGGVGGKIRFLQNITGLWILQRLIAQWGESRKETDYDVLIAAAEVSDITSVIDVDAAAFVCPSDMEAAIADYCRARRMQVPETQGDYVRCVLQSLAQRYKQGLEQLNSLLPAPVEALRIIGGGCRNRLLNRLTEEALGIPVYAGPVEATAIGNILVQALAKGEIKSRDEIKVII
ncbi:MAG: rhamnulokinase [Bacteroides sp.]|nr:rhamnulokinase [Bacteroides sp.]